MMWFRLYHDVVNNPKVQRLPARLFKAWVNLLCLASENSERGTLPALEDMAFRLRTSPKMTTTHIERLIEAGLIDRHEDTLRMHDWDDLQYASDSSTERVREHRASKNETPVKRFGNDSVTPPDTEAEPEQIRPQRRKEHIPKRDDVYDFLEARFHRQKRRIAADGLKLEDGPLVQ